MLTTQTCLFTCPTVVEVTEEHDICEEVDTEILDWQTSLTNNNAAAISSLFTTGIHYSTEAISDTNPQPNTLISTGIRTADDCSIETQTTFAYLFCFGPDAVMGGGDDSFIEIGSITLTLFPKIQAPTVLPTGCILTINAACDDDIITITNAPFQGTISDGTNQAMYTAPIGASAGTLEVNVTSGLTGNSCVYMLETKETPACVEVCPIANSVESIANSVCSGENISSLISSWINAVTLSNPLDNIQDENDVGAIVYSSVTPIAGVVLPDDSMPNGVLSLIHI